MKKIHIWVVCALIMAMLTSCKAGVDIVVGYPAEGTTAAVDYTSSKPISDKRTVNRILLALLSGESLAGSAAPSTPPDAVMMIQPNGENIAYQFSVWVGQTSVIYARGTGGEATEYRMIDNLPDEEYRIFDRIKAAKD